MPATSSPRQTRPVLLPAVLGAIAVLAGLIFIGGEGYMIIRYIVSILALIVAVMTLQVGRWPWALPLVVLAVLWNPVYPLPFTGTPWAIGHIVGAAVFLAVGLLLRVPEEPARPLGR